MRIPRTAWTLAAAALIVTTALPGPAWPSAPRPRSKSIHRAPAIVDVTGRMNINNLDMFVTNHGSFAYDQITGNAGLIYPKGTDRSVVFAAGPWIGAIVNSELRVAVGEYAQEFVPGPMINGHSADDQLEYRNYRIVRGDVTSPDYLNWPTWQGAPLGSDGKPLLSGDATIWSVYNDADPLIHQNRPGSTAPLGVEIQQTTFAFNRSGPLANTVYVKFLLINKGTNTLEDMYFTLWSDPDLGGFTDDLVGCDPALNMGFAYNATNADQQYGAQPPAVGYYLIKGPVVQRMPGVFDTLGLGSFNKYINGTDPADAIEDYNTMQGLHADGSPVHVGDDPGQPTTTFSVSGDPVAGTGWLDTDPADRRLTLSTGPFRMVQSEKQEIVIAIHVGQGGDRLSSIAELRSVAPIIRSFADGIGPPSSDQAPVVSAPASVITEEGGFFSFNVFATDPDGDPIASVTADPLPPGALFFADSAHRSATFTWSPGFGDAGIHTITFTASNALSGSATTTIDVADVNQAPVSETGGPYLGVVNSALYFDGSRSSDPDGDPLLETWNFGDGASGTGATPSHTYSSTAGSPYLVTLTVSDGFLSSEASTIATIQESLAANAFYPFHLNYIFPQVFPTWVRVEPLNSSFEANDVLISTATMTYNGVSILTACKSGGVGDINRNGIKDIRVCFAQRDLKTLFAGLPNGTTDAVVTIRGDLAAGGQFTGDVSVHVVKLGWLGAGSLASISPNPLNPQGLSRS